jgi:hypothetical protein
MALADLFPAGNYTPENSPSSRYFNVKKLNDGESTTLRLCGSPRSHHAICGFTYFTMEGRPRRFAQYPKDYLEDIGLSFEGKTKGTGEKASPTFFLSWACLRKEAPDEFQIFDINQGKVREQIEAVLAIDDYETPDGELANFYLTISRKGLGKDSKYTVMPTLKVATKADQQRWAEAREGIYLPALYEGGDPFMGKPSDGEAPISSTPITHRDELGADHEVAAGSDW